MIEKSKAILYHVDISQWYFLVFQFKIMFYFLISLIMNSLIISLISLIFNFFN